MQRTKSAVLALLLSAAAWSAEPQLGQWPYYGGDAGGSKYSALAQIDAGNVRSLDVAWTWDSPDDALVGSPRRASRAISTDADHVDGVLYTATAFSQVAAIGRRPGDRLGFDPRAYEAGLGPRTRFAHRGARTGRQIRPPQQPRIRIATARRADRTRCALGPAIARRQERPRDPQSALIAQEKTGATSAQCAADVVGNSIVVVCNVSIVRCSRYAAVTQAFAFVRARLMDLPTRCAGNRAGVRHENALWKSRAPPPFPPFRRIRNASLFIPSARPPTIIRLRSPRQQSVPEACTRSRDSPQARVALPGRAHGFGKTFPGCADARDITVDGRRIAPVGRSATRFNRIRAREPAAVVADRKPARAAVAVGREDYRRSVSDQPPPFAARAPTMTVDFTGLRAEALKIVADYTLGPLLLLRRSSAKLQKGVLRCDAAGGANWGGAGFDPETGYLFLQSANIVSLAAVVKNDGAQKSAYTIRGAAGPPGPQGLPLIKPPYGVVTAIDLNKGAIAWQVAHGNGPLEHPALKPLLLPPLGASSHTYLSSGGPLVTKTLLFRPGADSARLIASRPSSS